MEIDFIVNHGLLSPKQRPAWYRGEKLIKSLDTERCGELSGQELDEIIDETLTNPVFKWNGKDGLASFLGLNCDAMKDMIWTWNKHKILFAKIAADTPYGNSAIINIAGRHAKRCWQRYRHFVDSGGCQLPVDPAILYQNLHPRTKKTLRLSPELSSWSEFRRVNVGAVGVNAGLFPQDAALPAQTRSTDSFDIPALSSPADSRVLRLCRSRRLRHRRRCRWRGCRRRRYSLRWIRCRLRQYNLCRRCCRRRRHRRCCRCRISRRCSR